MDRDIILVEVENIGWPDNVGELDTVFVSRPQHVRAALGRDENTLWIARDPRPLRDFIEVGHSRRRRDLLLLEPVPRTRREAMRQLFDNVVAPDDEIELLPEEQLFAVLAEDHPGDYFIGAGYDTDDELVVLYRGNMEALGVKEEMFEANERATPEPEDLEIVDWGQTLRMGEYEISADSILYRRDAEFRKRRKEHRKSIDDSLGGSIHRLRSMKGLNQDDINGVTERTVRRIEKNEVEPRTSTRQKLADALDVEPDELDTY